MNPPSYPEKYVEPLTLRDGRTVLLRPILPEDAALLQEGFSRLSTESVYMRFLETANALSDEQARRMAAVDYHDQMAFVGEIEEQGHKRLVVSARYSVIPDHTPRAAEVAIVVRDDYQSNGIGKAVMDRLIRYAAEHGVKMFTGTMHTSNQRILNFIARSGLPFERKMIEPGVWDYKILLSSNNETEPAA